MLRTLCRATITGLILAGSTHPARAGIVTAEVAASGPGMGDGPADAIVFSFAPNNDNDPEPGNSGNALVTVDPLRFEHVAPIDLTFNVTPSEGVSEYAWTTFIQNDTGVDWPGFRIELHLTDVLGQVLDDLVEPSRGLDFDTPHRDTEVLLDAFERHAHTPRWIEWSAGLLAADLGFPVSVQFALDVPDTLHDRPLTRFAIRFIPLTEAPRTVLGDLDGNGVLDAFDVAPFELALADKFAYILAYPDVDPDFTGDMDDSRVLDAFDVSLLEARLANLPVQTLPTPDSGTLLLLTAGGLVRRRARR